MTEEKKIEQLLKAFYDGVSTHDEETLLLKFFNRKDLNEKWYSERDIFDALYDTSDIPLPEGITERLENAIDKHIAKSIIVAPLHQKTRKLFISISSAAAIVLLCVGLFFITGKNSQSHTIADTYTNPEEAALAAEQMLTLVSAKLNQGFLPLDKVKESMDKTNELLNEKLNQ